MKKHFAALLVCALMLCALPACADTGENMQIVYDYITGTLGYNRAVACGILRIPQERRFFFGDPPVNCSISIVRFADGRGCLHTFNDCAHLGNFCD